MIPSVVLPSGAFPSGALPTAVPTGRLPTGAIPSVSEQVRSRIERFRDGRSAIDGDQPPPPAPPRPEADAVLLNREDYLDIADDPRIAAAIGEALTGTIEPDARAVFEQTLADHMRAPAGVLCPSGWEANIGLMQTIADPRTPVYLDAMAHMSLWQGVRAAGAPLHPFRHNYPGHLREEIRTHGPGVIAVDAMYSTTGSRSPLPRLCEVAEQTGSLLVVDESRTLGVDGPHGEGAVVALGLAERVPIRTASLARALAGRAGFICLNGAELADHITQQAYPTVFSTPPLPHEIAGLAAALDVVRAEDGRRERLRRISENVRTALGAMGFDIGTVASHLVALPGGSTARTLAMRDFLAERGVFATALYPPVTPRDRSLVHLALHAGLTDDDIARIITACEQVRGAFGAAPPEPSAPRTGPMAL